MLIGWCPECRGKGLIDGFVFIQNEPPRGKRFGLVLCPTCKGSGRATAG